MPLMTLCPKLDPSSQLVRPWSPSGLGSDLEAEKLEREANRSLHQAIQRRQKLLQPSVHQDSEVSAFLASLDDRWANFRLLIQPDLQLQSRGRSQEFEQDENYLLGESTLIIAWEIFDCTLSRSILGEELEDIVILLRSSVAYQIELASVCPYYVCHLVH